MIRRRIALGPLEMLLADGDVRYVRIGGVEVLRRIYVGVRDERWGTIAGVLSKVKCGEEGGRWRASYTSEHQRGEVDFVWNGSVEAVVSGTGLCVTFRMDGEARSSFRTNRTGICVLHPIARCAGRPCEIEHADGSREQGQFPELIAPHQPFTNIRSMVHEPAAGMRVEVAFEGEIFETEDQRNWSDGSFKTYCRPLAMGFPYELKAGERVRQAVHVRVAGPVPERKVENAIRIGGDVGPLPAIGIQAGPGQDWQASENLARLRQLRVFLHDSGSMAEAMGVPIHVAWHCPAPAAASRHPVVMIVYSEGRPFAGVEDVKLVQERHAPHVPASAIGGGTVGNFTELNRNRPPAGSMPALSWPINPQVHATDDLSLIENLQGQGDTVRTARSFAPAAHLAVGPIILHRRPDPFAAGNNGAEAEEVKGDPRQRMQFGAAWTLVSIKRLAEAGADSLTYYETTGPFGVMDGGEVFPLYHVLEAVGEMTGARVLACESSDELAFDALALRRGKRLRVMVACLKDEPVQVAVRGLPDGARVVELGPYEVLTLDYDGKERM
jgi:D-apionolactonase